MRRKLPHLEDERTCSFVSLRSLQRRKFALASGSVKPFQALRNMDPLCPLTGLDLLVEMSGLEPPTSCLPDKRSPS
jgi:hypothetical protein